MTPSFHRRTLVKLLAAGTLPLVLTAQAQFRVEVSGVGLTQMPIAIATFRGEAQAPQKIGAIVKADLERSGVFRAVDTSGATLDESARPDLALWKQKGADSLVTGSVTPLADGRFDVRLRLWDVVRGQDLGGQSYAVTDADLRLSAHRVSDFVYEKLTGEKGIFSTRIAYVTKSAQRFTLWVADADGENAQSALASPEPIISPAWSPNGAQLAYVSFESRKPVIYAHDVASGKRRLLANFRGSNSAPAWSPDGRQIVATLSRDGGSQLYAIDANGGEPRRLTQSSSIDTEPAFSADGKYLAYVSRVGGAFKLQVMELAGGAVTQITDTNADESPSFAPNSRLIVYATQQQGKEALMTTTLDGKIKARLAGASGDIREPDWSPFSR